MAISLKYIQTINTSPAMVYRAFTNSTALREWLCDTASIDPRPRGRFFIAYKRGQAETIALISELPDEFVCMKGSFWRLGVQLLQINLHAREHAGQISLAVSAARH